MCAALRQRQCNGKVERDLKVVYIIYENSSQQIFFFVETIIDKYFLFFSKTQKLITSQCNPIRRSTSHKKERTRRRVYALALSHRHPELLALFSSVVHDVIYILLLIIFIMFIYIAIKYNNYIILLSCFLCIYISRNILHIIYKFK